MGQELLTQLGNVRGGIPEEMPGKQIRERRAEGTKQKWDGTVMSAQATVIQMPGTLDRLKECVL